jgi:hypothetical protein
MELGPDGEEAHAAARSAGGQPHRARPAVHERGQPDDRVALRGGAWPARRHVADEPGGVVDQLGEGRTQPRAQRRVLVLARLELRRAALLACAAQEAAVEAWAWAPQAACGAAKAAEPQAKGPP